MGAVHATHLLASPLFCTQQASHSQEFAAGFNLLKRELDCPPTGAVDVAGFVALCPGFGVVHAAHLLASSLFRTKHASHSHDDAGGLNLLKIEFDILEVSF